MKKISFFILFILFISCKRKENSLTLDVKYNKFDSIISIKYINNTNDNFFFINPDFIICKLELNDHNQYMPSSVSPYINEYSLIKDSSKNYSPFISVLEKNYLKYFSKKGADEYIKNLNKDNVIIILQKGKTYTQYIKINYLPPSGFYEMEFVQGRRDFLRNLKKRKDPYYNFFKSQENISYKNYLYYYKDFIIKNNRFAL